MQPIARRLLTRALALGPAVVTILALGEGSTGHLLVLSQVVLSLQLSFAVIPLILIVSDRRWMGQYVIGPLTSALSWVVAVVIVALNLMLGFQEIMAWLRSAGAWAWVLWVTVVPVAAGLIFLLGWVSVVPILERRRGGPTRVGDGVHGPLVVPEVRPAASPDRIAAALDFSTADGRVLSFAVTLARAAGRSAEVVLLHVVESGGARMFGDEHRGQEATSDQERLELYTTELTELGVAASYDLGFGETTAELAELVRRHRVDMVVMGSHGHGRVGDFVHGTSVERLRHRIDVPVLVVPTGPPAD
jgi:manganese transport protein